MIIVILALVAGTLLIVAAWCFIDDLARITARAINRRLRPLPAHRATPPRRVHERTEKPAGDKAQREARYDELRPLPAPGKTIYTDHTVRLPWTPPAAQYIADLTDRGLAEPCTPGTEAADYDQRCYRPCRNDPLRSPARCGPCHLIWPAARVPTTAELDDLKDRFDAAQGWLPSEPAGHLVGDLSPARDERKATDTDVRTVTCAAPARPAGMPAPDVTGVLPDWVIKALNGHNGVDAAVDSIVARAAVQ